VSLGGVGSSMRLVVSAVRHVGWWIDWHTRVKASAASRALEGTEDDSAEPSPAKVNAA
jgi:hypothetical protein